MVPWKHRRCATSRERQSVSSVVLTLSQPFLRFNLCWHDTDSALQIFSTSSPCCPQFKDEGEKIAKQGKAPAQSHSAASGTRIH